MPHGWGVSKLADGGHPNFSPAWFRCLSTMPKKVPQNTQCTTSQHKQCNNLTALGISHSVLSVAQILGINLSRQEVLVVESYSHTLLVEIQSKRFRIFFQNTRTAHAWQTHTSNCCWNNVECSPWALLQAINICQLWYTGTSGLFAKNLFANPAIWCYAPGFWLSRKLASYLSSGLSTIVPAEAKSRRSSPKPSAKSGCTSWVRWEYRIQLSTVH
jgi:hypothetical protein